MSKCKYCGAEIDFVKRPHTEVWIPVEARPVLYLGAGATEILTPTGEKRRVHVVKDGPRCGLFIGYLPHQPNCPYYQEQEEDHEEEDDEAWWQKVDL